MLKRNMDLLGAFMVGLVACYLLVAVPPAMAAHADCAPADISHIAYVCTNSTYQYGGQASIQYRVPDICSTVTTNNWSEAWVMLRNNGGDGWTQIGYQTKNYGTAHRYFWQWTKCYPGCTDSYCSVAPCVHTAMWGSPQSADYHTFTAQRLNSDGKIHLMLDGSDAPDNGEPVPSHTSFDPVNQSSWPHPFITENSEEIHQCGTDFPGTPTYRTNFTSIQQADIYGGWTPHSLSSSGWDELIGDDFGKILVDTTYPPAHFWAWTDRGDPDLTCT